MFYACKILGGTERLVNLDMVEAFLPAGSEGLRRTAVMMADGNTLDIEGSFREHMDRLVQAKQVADS
jgi:hypothetical protein